MASLELAFEILLRIVLKNLGIQQGLFENWKEFCCLLGDLKKLLEITDHAKSIV